MRLLQPNGTQRLSILLYNGHPYLQGNQQIALSKNSSQICGKQKIGNNQFYKAIQSDTLNSQFIIIESKEQCSSLEIYEFSKDFYHNQGVNKFFRIQAFECLKSFYEARLKQKLINKYSDRQFDMFRLVSISIFLGFLLQS
ncbi:unnamed protein product [Paramecium primaurelia]|uniref:Uncharacterized protein n=1 Tax=Paramecium primaurelia TaxID=5886 RepID=A0A8S1PP87_PARPR|nr:unnamed protein product [Paramecium primaurelia]